MNKKEKILKEISNNLIGYLKEGKINFSSVIRKSFPEIEDDNLRTLLKIHFILTKNKENRIGVISFLKKLKNRLRRLKTTTKKIKQIYYGRIRGPVDWKETFNNRLKRNNYKNYLFVCKEINKNYNITENIILFKLLKILNSIINNDLFFAIENEYSWVKDYLDKDFETELKDLLHRNIYLSKISLIDIKITQRMINKTIKSRYSLYSESAILLDRYYKLMNLNFDESEFLEILENTFIKPDNENVLFELYWLVKVLDKLKNYKLELLKPQKNVFATFENDTFEFKIYHNSTGSLSFKEKLNEIQKKLDDKNNFIGREIKVLEKLKNLTERNFENSLWGGIPDILIEKRKKEKQELQSLFIGEVKNTKNISYIVQGLKELLEYIAFIKENNNYILKFDDLFDNLQNIEVGLFIDEVKNINISDEHIKLYIFNKKEQISLDL